MTSEQKGQPEANLPQALVTSIYHYHSLYIGVLIKHFKHSLFKAGVHGVSLGSLLFHAVGTPPSQIWSLMETRRKGYL
jgi:hypothetical protein